MVRLVVWQNRGVVNNDLLKALASQSELRVVERHPQVNEVDMDEIFIGCYKDSDEVKAYEQYIMSLARQAAGVIVVVPRPWELEEKMWSYSWQHRLYLSDLVPPAGFGRIIRYTVDMFRAAQQSEFLNKLYFLMLLAKIHSEREDWDNVFKGILSVLVSESQARRGLLLVWEGANVRVIASEGFAATDDMVQGFMNSLSDKDVAKTSDECLYWFEELVRGMGYSCRQEDLHMFLLRARGQEIGWLCLHGSMNEMELNAVNGVCDYLASLLYIYELENGYGGNIATWKDSEKAGDMPGNGV